MSIVARSKMIRKSRPAAPSYVTGRYGES